MRATAKAMMVSAALLGGFSLLAFSVVSGVEAWTAAKIRQNQRQELLLSMQSLLPAGEYDNALWQDRLDIQYPAFGDKPVAVYRARQQGRPVAAILLPTAMAGYGGDIHLLVAIRPDGSLLGVRALSHHETPGLGDFIEEKKSAWIFGFAGLSLHHPPEKHWRVKRDGGVFDQFAGATVTPRAVVGAVRDALKYFREHQESLFAPAHPNAASPGGMK